MVDRNELVFADEYSQYCMSEIQKSWSLFLNSKRTISRCPMFLGISRKASGDSALPFRRNPAVRGPISVFGYDYLRDKIGDERYSRLQLLQYQGLRGAGGDYAYEVLNWTYWGMRVIDIRNFVSATYRPIPVGYVLEFLKAAQDAGIVTQADGMANCNPGQ